jgi:Thaumarchaeal output domain 1
MLNGINIMKFVYIGDRIDINIRNTLFFKCKIFYDDVIEALEFFKNNQIKKKVAIIVNINCPEKSKDTLSELRRFSGTSLLPIVTCIEDYLTPLYDCKFKNFIVLESFVEEVYLHLKSLLYTPQDGRECLLVYLYSRKNFLLVAEKNWKNPDYYFYPLLSLFSNKNDDNNWLQEMRQNKILNAKTLIDTFFSCKYCDSAHLQFTDRCPTCKSQDIEECQFLHCFKCGLISTEKEFLNKGGLQCPKCLAKLKHFGDEYDRPLDSGQCRVCNQFYINPYLESKCMLCNVAFEADSLKKKEIYSLFLSEYGHNFIKTRYVAFDIGVAKDIKYVDANIFFVILSWLIQVSSSESKREFCLLAVNIKLKKNYKLLPQNFICELKLSLTSKQTLTRLSEDFFCILLPEIIQDEIMLLKEKIDRISLIFEEALEISVTELDDEHKFSLEKLIQYKLCE